MTASRNFFKDMSREQIKEWADTCMEFVYNDLGYKKEQILHVPVHLDELTPHIHCVVVPLVKKYDKRTNTERYTISKKQYIKDKIQLSQLQDLYHKRLTEKGYDLERGIKGSDNQHIKIKEYKKVMELQPKLPTIFNEVDSYANSYKSLEKENQKYKNEVSKLETENKELKDENRSLIYRLNELFQLLKKFLRKLLQRGNDYTKDETVLVVKDCYNNEEFDMGDVVNISRRTTK